jgi:hypothetical protein
VTSYPDPRSTFSFSLSDKWWKRTRWFGLTAEPVNAPKNATQQHSLDDLFGDYSIRAGLGETGAKPSTKARECLRLQPLGGDAAPSAPAVTVGHEACPLIQE